MRYFKWILILVFIGVSFWGIKNAIIWYKENEEKMLIYLEDKITLTLLPYKIAKLSSLPEDKLLPIPVSGVSLSSVADTWQARRAGGRTHEGVDIFAKSGTSVFSATEGYIVRTGVSGLGGINAVVIGPGGVRYYYAHLEKLAEGVERGFPVTKDTVIGFVGNTGNAINTSSHLHFGIYDRGAKNPYPFLVDRN